VTLARLGVFCLEGEWTSNLASRSTVRPLLELLEGQQIIKYIHRDVSTVEELRHLLDRWPQRQYKDYTLGYFAFHGTEGSLSIGRSSYTLDDIADAVRGRLAGKIVYFGSCSTIDVDEDDLRSFQRATKARAVCGFTEDVDWLESAAFEMLVIDSIASYSRIDAPFKMLEKEHAGFVDRLGFAAYW